MKILNRLERRFGRYAVPNLTVALIFCQVVFYVVQYFNRPALGQVVLVPGLVLQGQVWRLVTFLFQPPLMNPLYAFFFWYLFYLMGTALERTWGIFRYNLFLLIGYVVTVGAAFVTPERQTYNGFLQGSVFLAFAFLYPDFQLLVFFLIPVKVKWLALLQWIGYLYAVVFEPWPVRLATLASIGNFLLFFWGDLFLRLRSGYRRMEHQARQPKQRELPRHRCRICGRTDKTDPQLTFRYCSKCAGSCCYCEEHLHNHEHVTADEEADSGKPGSPR
jgi:hypothetical protein